MKATRIKVLTIIGLITVVLLQTLWLSNMYTLIKANITEKSNVLIFSATNRELLVRFADCSNSNIIPAGTEMSILDISDTGELTSQSHYVQEILSEYGSELSLTDIDSIYTALLREEGIYAKSVVSIVTENDSIVQSSKDWNSSSLTTITSKKIPIRIDGSLSVQAIIVNPYWAVFTEMGVLIIATILMVSFVLACIIYQIRIIIKQNKIAQLREDFSHAMIHDMKSPITSICMGLSILRSGKLDEYPERKERHFDIMEDETKHLLALTNKVLTIAKSEQATLQLQKVKAPIRPIINDLVEKFNAKKAKSVVFMTIFKTETVYADPEYLKEVMSNLIDNAIKYSRNEVEILITCTEKENMTLIKVRDNGYGIPLKDQAKIFEKFERASATGRRHKGGATGFGLGLNFVQRIVEAHKGRITIESIEGQYSEFTISLPILIQEI